MNWLRYYSETLDRIIWTDGTGETGTRQRVDALLAAHPELGHIESRVVEHAGQLPEAELSARTIVVRAPERGDLGRCPGTHGHLCCNYLTLNVYLGCTLGCTYCIMQSYLRNRTLEIHLPAEGTVASIRELALSQPEREVRLGTGEVGDSLLYDPLFGISGDLITALADLPNLRFELKTKTNFVDHLPAAEAFAPGQRSNTVISFSVNPPELISAEEGVAARLEERLAAANRAAERGFRVAFHFDPMIRIPGWEEAYGAVAERLGEFRSVTPEWISLGTLRYPPSLKYWIEQRPYGVGEFIRSDDGKMRYLQPLRAEMYRLMKSRLERLLPQTPVYLCMESAAVWRNLQARTPGEARLLRRIMQPVTIGGVSQ